MKTKKLWLVVLAVLVCMTACLVGCKSKDSYTEPIALRITNKTELRADWFEGGADRTLQLDVPAEVSDSDILITSGNPSVVEADGRTLKAKGVGVAKITVSIGDESDDVTVTVLQAPTEISITNKPELEKIALGGSKTIEYSVRPDSVDRTKITVSVTSDNTGILTVDGDTLTAVASGTATVTVSTFGLTDTVSVSVVGRTAPTFVGVTQVNGSTNTDIALPVKATACDDEDLREHVTAICSGGMTFDKTTMTVKTATTGEYTVQLSVADPNDPSLTASTTITVNVYRNLFYDVNGYNMVDLSAVSYEEGKQYAADAEQAAFFDRHDSVWASFDMTPSKTYYAEVTYAADSVECDYGIYYGMAHTEKNDITRWLTTYIDRGHATDDLTDTNVEEAWRGNKPGRNVCCKDVDLVNDSNCWEINAWNDPRELIIHVDRIYQNRLLDCDIGAPFPFTFAVARVGDYFYTFINGQYIMCVTNAYFADKDTVPGVFQQTGVKTDITKISWLTGTEAENKVNSLTKNNNGMIDKYRQWDVNHWDANNGTKAADFEVSSDAADGINVIYKNADKADGKDGAISPYLFFDRNFTLEWNYEFTSASHENWLDNMYVEVCNARNINKGVVQLGATIKTNGSDNVCALLKCLDKDNTNFDTKYITPTPIGGETDWFNLAVKKLHFSLTRICTVDVDGEPIAQYVFNVKAADNSKEYTAYWTLTNDNINKSEWKTPCDPVLLVWKNRNVSGKYTNIEWSVPETSPIKYLAVTNAAELATMEIGKMLSVQLDALGLGDVQIISGDPAVVAVDGKQLTAKKEGSTTVTVSADGVTPVTVNITVVKPSLKSVTITNKDELKANWKVDSVDKRTVQIALSPSEFYNTENTTVTVESSNTGVVTVGSNYELTVVGVGKATITVTAGDVSDTVEIVVTSNVPVIILSDTDIVYGAAGDEIVLPTADIIDTDGTTLDGVKAAVTCASSDAAIDDENGTFTATAIGEYTVKYSYENAADVEYKVRVYRKAIASVYADGVTVAPKYNENGYLGDAQQSVTLNTDRVTFAQYNMTAGKDLYAEATFVAPPYGTSSTYYGIYGANPSDKTHYLAAMTDRGPKTGGEWARATKIIEFNTETSGWSDDIYNGDKAKYFTRNVFDYGRKITETAENSVTIALARIDDLFYMFIDGQVIMGFASEYYRGSDMVLGIFQKNNSDAPVTSITAMSYLAGDDAKTKFNALTQNGSKLLGEYKPDTWWKNDSGNVAGQHMSTDQDANKGANFTYTETDSNENHNVVTPNIFFDGDFTFEWEYQFATGTTAGGWVPANAMSVEIRNAKYSNWGVQMKATCVNNGGNNLCINALINQSTQNSADAKIDLTNELNGGNNWYNDADYSHKYKFSISRVCGTGNSATYTFKAWILENGGYTPFFASTKVIDSDIPDVTNAFGNPNNGAIVTIKNAGVTGTFTNIKWSATAPSTGA